MALSPARVCLCEPTHLYNIITQCVTNDIPAVAEESHLILFDARDIEDYEQSHCLLARLIKKEESGDYHIPFDCSLSTCLHCIVYDSNTVSLVENTPAVALANQIACNGSRNTVKILKGGYDRFSAEYPFLRTSKVLFTLMELRSLPRYPSEILPLFLYLGDSQHAYNASLTYDMKIRAHVNSAEEMCTAFPGSVSELHLAVQDTSYTDLLARFQEACEFIDSCRKKSIRVMVFGEHGISRAASVTMAYLIWHKKWSLQESHHHVQQCRPHIRPLSVFLAQLGHWEKRILPTPACS